MSSNCISSTLEMSGEREAEGNRRDGQQGLGDREALKKPVKKTIKKQKTPMPVPTYALVTGKSYDVSGTHTSVKDAEYMGHEIIGQLVFRTQIFCVKF